MNKSSNVTEITNSQDEYTVFSFYDHNFALVEEDMAPFLATMGPYSKAEIAAAGEKLERMLMPHGKEFMEVLQGLRPQDEQELMGLVLLLVSEGITKWPQGPREEIIPPRHMMH